MKYRLYYDDGSAAMGIRVLLEEFEQVYELIHSTIDMDKPRTPEFLALNPNGWVPVLVYGDNAIYEAAAITTFLCDRHPEFKLAPGANDPERGYFLQWLVYFSSSIQNAFQMTYYPFRFVDSEEDYASAEARGVRRLRETWSVVDDAIGDREWLLGDAISAADIYMFMITTWLNPDAKGHPQVSEFQNVERICRKVAERPSVRKVYGPA